MAILASLGKLATALSCTTGVTVDSTNVISMPAHDWAAYTDLWLWITTTVVATGDASDTYKFALVMSEESTLDTNTEVCSTVVTDFEERRLVTVGKTILAINVGKQMSQMMETAGDTTYFVGLQATLSDGAAITIAASLTPYEPRTSDHKLVTVSNVTVPDVASPGSGFVV